MISRQFIKGQNTLAGTELGDIPEITAPNMEAFTLEDIQTQLDLGNEVGVSLDGYDLGPDDQEGRSLISKLPAQIVGLDLSQSPLSAEGIDFLLDKLSTISSSLQEFVLTSYLDQAQVKSLASLVPKVPSLTKLHVSIVEGDAAVPALLEALTTSSVTDLNITHQGINDPIAASAVNGEYCNLLSKAREQLENQHAALNQSVKDFFAQVSKAQGGDGSPVPVRSNNSSRSSYRSGTSSASSSTFPSGDYATFGDVGSAPPSPKL